MNGTNLFYRLNNSTDPEERFEDAAMWKALHDEYGSEITLIPPDGDLPESGVVWGRLRNSDFRTKTIIGRPKSFLPYWLDEAFLSRCGRSFKVCDLDEARKEVGRLHAEGKGAFIKALQTKFHAQAIPIGETLDEAIGPMAYSYAGAGACLMVQEFVEMTHEHRFVIVGRKVVTCSPVAYHLTPMSHAYGISFEHPQDTNPVPFDRFGDLLSFAVDAAQNLKDQDCILDVALSEGRPILIELNAMHIGRFGLYCCSPVEIARASRDLIQ